jgi:transcriptional regulator with XRE-family HTH domain
VRKNIKGALLIAAIYKEIAARGITQTDAAQILGIAKSYLAALLNGTRSLDGLRRQKIEAIANFIRVPPIQVRILAEEIPVKDFFHETTLVGELDVMHERLLNDKAWCAYAPNPELWKNLPLDVKRLVGLLYERVSHEDFLSKASALEISNAS